MRSLYVLSAEVRGCRKWEACSSTKLANELWCPVVGRWRFARFEGGSAQLMRDEARHLRTSARITRTGAQYESDVPLWNSYEFYVCSFYFPTDCARG